MMPRLSINTHPFLTAEVLQTLFKKSIYTCLTFVQKKPTLLSSITGLHYDEVLKVQDSILANYSSPLKRGDKFYAEIIDHCALISTGIQALDTLLEGGFLTGNIYEFCGFEGCGKTQICMTVCLNIILTTPHQVFYIDTKNDISPKRLHKILISRNIKGIGEILERIKISHPKTAYSLLNDLHLLKNAFSEVKEKYLGFKVIIIDSLSALFQNFCDLSECLSILNNMANIMNFLASEYHLIFLVTNFVTCWTTFENSSHNNTEEVLDIQKIELPALGKYWTHVPSTRIIMRRRGTTDVSFLTILKSECQPRGKSVRINIGNDGVT